MAKDPAALFYISNWLTSTAELKSDERGWYLNLILHQFDKGDLPSEVEELAHLAGVRISEYNKFATSWQHVLQQKFNMCCDNGRIKNSVAAEIIRAREIFKDKKSGAGKMSSVVKKAMLLSDDPGFIDYVKENFDLNDLSKSQHLLQQMLQLYINTITNKDIDVIRKEGMGENQTAESAAKKVSYMDRPVFVPEGWPKEEFTDIWKQHREYKKKQHKFEWKDADSEKQAIEILCIDCGRDYALAKKVIAYCKSKTWKGIEVEWYFNKHPKERPINQIPAHKEFSTKKVAV
jgi:hypothetical protein